MITEAIFDCETQKLFSEISSNDPADLEISLVSVYVRTINDMQEEISGTMHSFWIHELPQMWPHFIDVKRVIGFNSLRFDVPALARHSPPTFAKLPHFDVMQKVRDALGYSIGLNALATHTLGAHKTDVGTNAVLYWKSQTPEDLAKLKYYCEADVMLTRDLYDYGVREKKLKYMDKWNTLREFPVDFSYPKAVIDASRQIGLF
jgi:DEAD/DEAH box helicase domain-containing protein